MGGEGALFTRLLDEGGLGAVGPSVEHQLLGSFGTNSVELLLIGDEVDGGLLLLLGQLGLLGVETALESARLLLGHHGAGKLKCRGEVGLPVAHHGLLHEAEPG